ncbi:pyrimidine operon attenuation protein / uracil phosphoribosyltransferase [Mariprofundus micogutta]|uniref:Pyrimidine operon attenuation protein / uracil phosphoribosyltransferase n=1 Tax=Mariprofundus micogutta TaxID=1921010 RepID=A0A1L8CMN7_9PROT|nr:bifunctional pyr operon transcriptional regulator/uracil phosphoribosyltransferase PyrR [Mariprofundus micogutta]GAV20172.1 pyrimidine operon attenuation protein / uracil phosphoribosyltransferase [Mariprofundus micogutta]
MTDSILFDQQTVEAALNRMADAMLADEVHLVGIHSGGAKVADAIEQRLEQNGSSVCRGNLDISFYRDDLDTIGPNPEVRPSELPFDVAGKDVWLVDDVLYTGRTIRAAMDEIFDYGRPASIRLAVLVDRGGRQLPIAAQCAGLSHQAPKNCTVELVTEGAWIIEQRQVK